MNGRSPRIPQRSSGAAWTVLGLAFALWVSAGCSRAPRLVLHNRSAAPVTGLVVAGTGFRHELGGLAPGGSLDVAIHPDGDSAVDVSFDAGGRHVESGPLGYVERSGGIRLELEITPDLGVRLVPTGSAPSTEGREGR